MDTLTEINFYSHTISQVYISQGKQIQPKKKITQTSMICNLFIKMYRIYELFQANDKISVCEFILDSDGLESTETHPLLSVFNSFLRCDVK